MVFMVSIVWIGFWTIKNKDFYYVEINDDLVRQFQELDRQNLTIHLNSYGGSPVSAHEISKIMVANKFKLIVNKECQSACAETILPSAEHVEFVNEPIIGFHWNSLMTFDLTRRYGGDLTLCNLKEVEDQKALLLSKDMNIDFWKQTEKRLVLEHYEVIPKTGGCPWKRRRFKNNMWLPTSKQLRSLSGLTFTGSVCSDDFDKCTKKIDRTWKKGIRIVVGDEVYISKGR